MRARRHRGRGDVIEPTTTLGVPAAQRVDVQVKRLGAVAGARLGQRLLVRQPPGRLEGVHLPIESLVSPKLQRNRGVIG